MVVVALSKVGLSFQWADFRRLHTGNCMEGK